MANPAPSLGYGQNSEATIDQANIAMRGMPWYQTLLKSWGQDPGHPHDLSDSQKTAIVRGAQANGFVIDESHMDVDDNGNFENQGHGLRNTLIVVGLAAATIATMGVAGAFTGPALAGEVGAEAGATGAAVGTTAAAAGWVSPYIASGVIGMSAMPALTTVAATTAISSAAATIGTKAAQAAAVKVAAGGGTVTAESILKAGADSGNTATTAATDGSTPPWEGPTNQTSAPPPSTSATNYANILKYGLPTAGGIVSSLINANTQGNASAAQLQFEEQALAYQKEKDAYDRQVAAAKVTTEAGRYGDYTSRVQPWIDNGTTSNDRMASLLGLPARTGSTSSGGSSSGGSSGVPVSPAITAADLANYKALGLSPTGRGTGATDSAYYDDEIAATGGLTPANTAYWFGPNGRIAQDAAKAGVKPTAATPPVTPPPTSTPYAGAAAPPVTTQPQATAPEPTVMMKGPDGSTKSIPQSQVAYYEQKGAVSVQGAA